MSNLQIHPNIQAVTARLRRDIIELSTSAGSGHPTSSLSAVDVMAVLFADGIFHYDVANPYHEENDRLIFSKGHASPLYYALWAIVGGIKRDELMTFRQFDSILEGHPTMRFPYTEAATGSLGQGLGVGVGMALAAKYENRNYKTYVLLGDSEIAEGSVWEAVDSAREYELHNLIAIVDLNRLGQRGQTMHGHNAEVVKAKFEAFGWSAYITDGNDIESIRQTMMLVEEGERKPAVIIAKTLKGAGVSFLADADGWHGKALSEDDAQKAYAELGEVDNSLTLTLPVRELAESKEKDLTKVEEPSFQIGDGFAPRKAYGKALAYLGSLQSNLVVLDAEVSNSTFAKEFADVHPDRFFEMYIAEQNMVSVATGLSRRGYKPFVSTFAAFFARAFDQIRMAQYSSANITFVGSHAGVSIGEDGSSQMGLEEIAMFRALFDSVVLYPSDSTSTARLVEEAYTYTGLSYIRTTRADLPTLYEMSEEFSIGGSKTLRSSEEDFVTLIGAGVTLHEALNAADSLKESGIHVRVIDLYCVKPLDIDTLQKAAAETSALIVVEDHGLAGGMTEAVRSGLEGVECPVYGLTVDDMPRSGKPDELLEFEGINAAAIKDMIISLAELE
jgi:transketolase